MIEIIQTIGPSKLPRSASVFSAPQSVFAASHSVWRTILPLGKRIMKNVLSKENLGIAQIMSKHRRFATWKRLIWHDVTITGENGSTCQTLRACGNIWQFCEGFSCLARRLVSNNKPSSSGRIFFYYVDAYHSNAIFGSTYARKLFGISFSIRKVAGAPFCCRRGDSGNQAPKTRDAVGAIRLHSPAHSARRAPATAARSRIRSHALFLHDAGDRGPRLVPAGMDGL